MQYTTHKLVHLSMISYYFKWGYATTPTWFISTTYEFSKLKKITPSLSVIAWLWGSAATVSCCESDISW